MITEPEEFLDLMDKQDVEGFHTADDTAATEHERRPSEWHVVIAEA